jgi:hypothetical protein
MEHHRLQPMGDYPVELFEKLYKQTHGLRRKLASQIDPRKFGVDYNEVLSWFDVKFIFLFSKYWETQRERLLGYIISGLTTYKRRITINSYQERWRDYANNLDVDSLWDNPITLDDNDEYALKREFYMEHLDNFMKSNLSTDAYLLFNIQLTPPPFIHETMKLYGLKHNALIPCKIIADYLGLDPNQSSIAYIEGLRLEVKDVQHKCAQHFKQNPVTYQPSFLN